MSEPHRSPDLEPPSMVARPHLAIVGTSPVVPTDDAHRDPAGEPNVGRTAVIGYVVGCIAATVAITVAGTLLGLGFGPSLGLGAFVGIWGGGGFGFMMGGTVPLARYADAQASEAGDRVRP